MAQVGPCRPLGPVGPQHLSQSLPLVWSVRLHSQIGQQGLFLARAELGCRLVTESSLKRPQQGQGKGKGQDKEKMEQKAGKEKDKAETKGKEMKGKADEMKGKGKEKGEEMKGKKVVRPSEKKGKK